MKFCNFTVQFWALFSLLFHVHLSFRFFWIVLHDIQTNEFACHFGLLINTRHLHPSAFIMSTSGQRNVSAEALLAFILFQFKPTDSPQTWNTKTNVHTILPEETSPPQTLKPILWDWLHSITSVPQTTPTSQHLFYPGTTRRTYCSIFVSLGKQQKSGLIASS